MTSRALRIGVVLGENLVEERTFIDGPVTIGQSLRCKLSIPVDGVPREHVLFLRDQNRWMLRQLDGTLAPVEANARGKLRLGDATVLYQEVAAPIAAPRPQLPAAVRGTLGDRIDRRLAVIIGGSLLVHAVIGAWAMATESEQPALFENRAMAEYRQDTFQIEVPDELPAAESAESGPGPGAAPPAAPQQQTPRPIVPRPATPPTQMSTNDAERFAQILTNNTEQAGGRTEIGKRIPGAELGTQIADIRDNGRTIGNDQNGFRNRDREGIGTGPQISRNEPTQLEQQGQRTERAPGRVELRPGPKPPDGPNPDGIIARIRDQYMRGLMRCYEVGLRGDGSLRGTVAVSFTVLETGKVGDPTARGVSSEVDSCVTTQMASWRFPIQKDKDGDPTELDIKLSLALVPTN
jgi:hypothetical protein